MNERYSNKKINPKFYGKIQISNLKLDQTPGDQPGYILAPFKLVDHTLETLNHYRALMDQYREQHKYCPKCGHDSHTTTLMAYILNTDKPENYKDLNKCVCSKCGDIHTTHDRITNPVGPDTLKEMGFRLENNPYMGRTWVKKLSKEHSVTYHMESNTCKIILHEFCVLTKITKSRGEIRLFLHHADYFTTP